MCPSIYPEYRSREQRRPRAPALSAPPCGHSQCLELAAHLQGPGPLSSGGLRGACCCRSSERSLLPPPRAVLGTRGRTPRMLAQRDPLIKRPRASSSHAQVLSPGGRLVPGQLFQGLSAELSFCWGLSIGPMTAQGSGSLGLVLPGSDLQKFPSGNGSPANPTPEPDSCTRRPALGREPGLRWSVRPCRGREGPASSSALGRCLLTGTG